MGCMADAADQQLMLTRFQDTEDLDSSELASELDGFIKGIVLLFVHGHVTKIHGYTSAVLEFLKTGRVLLINNKPVTLGGPSGLTDLDVRGAVQRLGSWVRLAMTVIESEYPNFALLNAFTIFDLKEGASERDNTNRQIRLTEPDHDVFYSRLAQFFAVDKFALMKEVADMRPTAHRIKHQRRCSNQEAWSEAAYRFRFVANKKSNISAADPVLKHWLISGPVTSGLEQNFADGRHAVGERAKHAPEITELIAMKLKCDQHAEETSEVVGRAQEYWVQCFDRYTQTNPTQERLRVPIRPKKGKKQSWICASS